MTSSLLTLEAEQGSSHHLSSHSRLGKTYQSLPVEESFHLPPEVWLLFPAAADAKLDGRGEAMILNRI